MYGCDEKFLQIIFLKMCGDCEESRCFDPKNKQAKRRRQLYSIFFPLSLFILSLLGVLCNRPMGMQTGRIKNYQITAASMWDTFHGPYLARLHRPRRGRYIGAWSAKYNNHYQWLQVDFKRAAKIIKISTQGRQDTYQWVTQYYVTRSLDRVHFMPYMERNSIKV